MTDLLGPANAPNFVTVRPADTRIFSGTDTFFKDCSSVGARDGTALQAAYLNGMLAQVRRAIRGMSVTEDNTDDDMLLKAIQVAWNHTSALITSEGVTPAINDTTLLGRAVRSQGINFAGSAGGTANALTATLPAPAPTAYSQIVASPVRFLAASANTGAITLAVNGLAAKAVVYPDGVPILAGELYSGRYVEVMYHTALDSFIFLSTPIRRLAYNNGQQIYSSSSGNWTTPANVYAYYAEIVGGGGGGGFGSGATGAGSGGGGGGYDEGWFATTPGALVAYSVGAGGAGAASSATDGTGGGTTTWGSTLLSATGGAGGQTPSSGALGNSRAGGTGGTARALNGSVSGGGLTGPLGGTGGMTAMKGSYPTNNATSTGNSGQGAGSGGGGGAANAAGGAGANGKIVIRW